MAAVATAQSAIERSVRKLDTDGDGDLDPDEITERARRYLQPIAEEEGLRLWRSNSIERVVEEIRDYYEDRERRRSRRIKPSETSGLRGFGLEEDEPMVPEFGSARVPYPYSRDDVERAERIIRRYDRNDDGFLDRREGQRVNWRDEDPFRKNDFNDDDRLSRIELAQRYARRRALEQTEDREELAERRFGSDRWDDDDDVRRRSSRRERESSRTSRYLSYSVFGRYDRDRDGRLEENEAYALGISRAEADLNRDGLISRDELDTWLFREMDGLGDDLSDILPAWFFERDENGDRQIDMAEFTSQWTDEKLAEFRRYDENSDGILTTQELLNSKAAVGGSYANDEAKVLMPHSTVVSEIAVSDDILIADLDVKLSITHTHVDELDGFLIGPDGQEIELFTGEGRHDDHFDETIFDDEAGDSITQARPPFRGRFRPEAERKDGPSLSYFDGKSVEGVWKLEIRATRSDRAGILHGWSLTIEPEEDPEESATTDANENA
jgi:subtilisin-like proprotein convertase family protein